MYTDLKVQKVGRRKWLVLEDWVTPFGTVPAGFISNGANIPRLLWSIMGSPAGMFFEAAVLHDYFYYTGKDSKETADIAFRDTAIFYKASTWRVKLAYAAVDLFGRSEKFRQ